MRGEKGAWSTSAGMEAQFLSAMLGQRAPHLQRACWQVQALMCGKQLRQREASTEAQQYCRAHPNNVPRLCSNV